MVTARARQGVGSGSSDVARSLSNRMLRVCSYAVRFSRLHHITRAPHIAGQVHGRRAPVRSGPGYSRCNRRRTTPRLCFNASHSGGVVEGAGGSCHKFPGNLLWQPVDVVVLKNLARHRALGGSASARFFWNVVNRQGGRQGRIYVNSDLGWRRNSLFLQQRRCCTST